MTEHNGEGEIVDLEKDPYIHNQMFTDRFISEVIGIVAPIKLHIDIPKKAQWPWFEGRPQYGHVRIRFAGESASGFEFETEQWGRTIGSAFRAVREQLRVESGR
jgi:hypothetical protein